MQTGTDHIAITIRELEKREFKSLEEQEKMNLYVL